MAATVFIDESGDAGMKLSAGASPYFVIAMVIFSDGAEMAGVTEAISQVRLKLGFSSRSEFKFNKSKKAVRKAFLEAVRPFDFKVRALVVKKENIRSEELRGDRRSFYAYFIKTALKHNGGLISDARIKIDGSGGREFKKEFSTYLRRELNGPQRRVIKEIRFLDSRQEPLVQLADMCAGSIHRAKSIGDRYYRDLIKDKIIDEWNFK